jgi:ABC-type branched-subunit amino acid transport system permease subunit
MKPSIRRFWHRRAQLLMVYGCVALLAGGVAVTAGYVGMAVLAHHIVQHRDRPSP